MLIALDYKDRALEKTCHPYILKPIALQSSDTLYCSATNLDNYGNKTTLTYHTHEFDGKTPQILAVY